MNGGVIKLSERDDAMDEVVKHYESFAERSRLSKFVPYIFMGSGLLAFFHELFLMGPYLYIGYRIAGKMNAERLEKPVIYLFWMPIVAFGLVKKAVWK
jgi:hypothetical protein